MRVLWIIFVIISTLFLELTPRSSYGQSTEIEESSTTTADQFMKDLMTSLVGKSMQMRFKIVAGEQINYRDHIGLNTIFDMTAPIFIKLYDPSTEAEMDPNFKPIAKTGDEKRKLTVQIRTIKDVSIKKNQMRLEVSFFENGEPTYLNFDVNMGIFDDPIALRIYSLSGLFNFQTGQSVTVADGRCGAEQKVTDWATKSELWKRVHCTYSYLYKHQNPNISEEERAQILEDIGEKRVEIGEPQFELSYSSCGKEQC